MERAAADWPSEWGEARLRLAEDAVSSPVEEVSVVAKWARAAVAGARCSLAVAGRWRSWSLSASMPSSGTMTGAAVELKGWGGRCSLSEAEWRRSARARVDDSLVELVVTWTADPVSALCFDALGARARWSSRRGRVPR